MTPGWSRRSNPDRPAQGPAAALPRAALPRPASASSWSEPGVAALAAALTLAGMGRDVLVLEDPQPVAYRDPGWRGGGVAADLGGAWLQQYEAKRWPAGRTRRAGDGPDDLYRAT
jgi:hypothetical protein